MSSCAPSRAQRRLAALSVLLGGLLAAAVGVQAGPAQAGGPCGNSYPYAGFGGKADPNGFFAPDMRSYVAACLNATGSDFARVETGPNGKTATFGEPTTWDATASSIGFGVTAIPVVGLVAQLRTGETAPLFDAQGQPSGTLRGGDLVGYVDAVYEGGQVLMRTYDTGTHAVRSFRMIAPRYLRLSGGHRANRVAPTASAKPSAKPSATPSPTAKPTVQPTPTPTPSATPSASPTTPTPVIVVNPPAKSSPGLAARYGKVIGIGGLVIAIILGIVVLVASRRTDDIGD